MKERIKAWLWRHGLLKLDWWDEPEVPVIRGETLRAALAARAER